MNWIYFCTVLSIMFLTFFLMLADLRAIPVGRRAIYSGTLLILLLLAVALR